MLHLEKRHYRPRESADEPVTTTCVYEVDRLGTTTECGLALAEDADLDVSAGRISWKESRAYRDRYQT